MLTRRYALPSRSRSPSARHHSLNICTRQACDPRQHCYLGQCLHQCLRPSLSQSEADQEAL